MPEIQDVLGSPVWNSLRLRLVSLLVKHALLHGDFTLASGKKSNVYLDVRRFALRREGMILIGKLLNPLIEPFQPDSIGGPTSGADPIVAAALMAENARPDLRGFFIRKGTKDHGTENLVDGAHKAGDKVVILEDVVTSGGSVARSIGPASQAGLRVVGVLAVVDREQGGGEKFREMGMPFYALTTMAEILEKDPRTPKD